LKLHLESASALNTFTGYGEGYVMVNGERIERSVVVLPDRLLPDWPPRTFDDLAPEHFAALRTRREIVLSVPATGRGFRARRSSPPVRAGRVEVMDCRVPHLQHLGRAARSRRLFA
jgi:uncharacterized protein